MYCVQCGVKLADTEEQCPLCHTAVYHPAIHRNASEPLYPVGKFPTVDKRSLWPQALLTAVLVLPMLIVLLCDLQFSSRITWSGYVLGALLIEFLLTVTFSMIAFIGWSLYPLIALTLLGGFLLFLGICRPARETMQRKFFI